jgi:ferric-dicitrate binding protein FerR (iron transport regulator)
MDKERIWILLSRKMSGEIGPAELKELEELLKLQNEVAGEWMEEVWAAPLRPAPVDEAEFVNWKAIQEGIDDKEGKVLAIKGYKPWLWAAASFVLLTLAGAGGYWYAGRNKSLEPIQESTASTTADSRSKIALPDGTTIWLNSDSKIIYNNHFGVDNRDITLKGEAYFDVAKNPSVPFVVHAGGLDIKVLGTAFNVTAYEKDRQVTTALVQGSVALSASVKPGWKLLLLPHQKISITLDATAHAVSTISPGTITTIQPEPKSNIIPEISWVDDKLVFYKETFGSLTKRMERWYGVDIEIKSEALEKVSLTGVFDKESLDQALKALQLSCQFHYSIHDNKVTITN